MPFCDVHLLKRPCRVRGLSLIELMVTLSILAVLGALAAPSFTNMAERMRVSAVTDELVASIHLTRAEAIQRNGAVGMTRLTGTGCPSLPSADVWSCGWQVFVDTDRNGSKATTEPTLQMFRITSGVNVVHSRSTATFTANRWGQVAGINAFGFVVSPTGTGVSSKATRTICVNSGGRVRILENSVTCTN